MDPGIRELKRRYKINLALGRTLPTHDLGVPLPLSTGVPLFDAALTDKVQATATMSEPEHLSRAWHLVRGASDAERSALAAHAGSLLNDYKLLLAASAWQNGDDEGARRFLGALPWGWRLSFPTALIAPGAALLTGWMRELPFRLVSDVRFPALRELFRELLAAAPGVAILKYRGAVKQSAALLKFRFEGGRERAIHALCFDKGRGLGAADAPEPIATWARARDALATGSVPAFLRALELAEHEIPITSYVGMLGGRGMRLSDDSRHAEALRDYAIRCATPVECLLRLAEWSPWLTEAHAESLASKVRHGIIERGIAIPFFKVTKAFMAAPIRVRKLILDPLYRPLLRHFGRRVSGLLGQGAGRGEGQGEGAALTFVQPGNVIHLMSFLLYAVAASAGPARLLLLRKRGVDEVDDLAIDDVVSHLADDRVELQRWLLSELGGITSRNEYVYDYPAAARVLRGISPAAPVVLDLPFARDMALLEALLPFEKVFNLNSALGAPGEICISYEYYQTFLVQTRRWSFAVWDRQSDSAAQRFAELLETLRAFEALAAAGAA